MKNVMYALIGVLALCVGILFYKVSNLQSISNGKSSNQVDNSNDDSSIHPKPISKTAGLPEAKIAYVNIDTLNENYLYISDFVKVLKNKRLALEGQLQSLSMKFQEDYETAQQSAQAGIMPPNELEMKRKDLERQQREIENKQVQMDKLAMEMQDKNDELQKNVKEFLIKFNNGKYDYIMAYTNSVPTILLANPELEITSQVLEALNNEYKNKKQSK